MTIWDEVGDHYKKNQKQPKMERKILRLLKQHPATSKDIRVEIEWHGMGDCTVKVSGEASPGAVRAAIFFAMPIHYKVNVAYV